MPTIVFYRQVRQDGGVRTGIELDRESLFGHLEEGPEEFNPLLTWFVDVECAGDAIPSEPSAVRSWLLAHAEALAESLRLAATELGLGHDPDTWTLQVQVPIPSENVRITVTCAANQRAESRQLATHLRELADQVQEVIHDLTSPQLSLV